MQYSPCQKTLQVEICYALFTKTMLNILKINLTMDNVDKTP